MEKKSQHEPSLCACGEKCNFLFTILSLPIRIYMRLFRQRILQQLRPAQKNADPQLVARNFSSNMQNMYAICKERNIRFFSLLQPLNGMGRRSLTDNDGILLSSLKGEMVEQNLSRFDFYSQYYSAIREINRNKPFFSDLTSVFDRETGQIFFDTVHFSDKGQRIVAEALYTLIMEESRK